MGGGRLHGDAWVLTRDNSGGISGVSLRLQIKTMTKVWVFTWIKSAKSYGYLV